LRASFYIVATVYGRYPLVNPGDYVIKIDGNRFLRLREYDPVTGKFEIRGEVDPRQFNRNYLKNEVIDDQDLLEAIDEFERTNSQVANS
jgi:hypothetical protein